jgi:hypothetical protein
MVLSEFAPSVSVALPLAGAQKAWAGLPVLNLSEPDMPVH